MTTSLSARTIQLCLDPASDNLLFQVEELVQAQLSAEEQLIRFAVTQSHGSRWTCDVAVQSGTPLPLSIFRFVAREGVNQDKFNVVMLVPTGIGASIGGHAGDATPAATLLSTVCDTLITHPNVLNASDIVQIPPNALYVEGSAIAQLLTGSLELATARNNRILVLVQMHEEEVYTHAAINSVNAARASYGLEASVVFVDSRFRMITEYADSGIALGRIEGIDQIFSILDAYLGKFDAVAITSVIEIPSELHEGYYRMQGEMVNPWGGVEAMLTHAISLRYKCPSAHAPMLESRWAGETDFGIVDPRMAAEVISVSFLQSVLRGLQRSPRLRMNAATASETTLRVEDVSCLVIPDHCVGIPTLGALQQGIPVIAVQGNQNLMCNELDELPWMPQQFYRVENYFEAAGLIAALRAGISPAALNRPFPSLQMGQVPVEEKTTPPVIGCTCLVGNGDAMADDVSLDKPSFEDYTSWYGEQFQDSLEDGRVEQWYESVTALGSRTIEQSHFWTELHKRLPLWDTEFQADHDGYPLFRDLPNQVRILTKPFSSIISKSFRWNVLDNRRWPNPPERLVGEDPADADLKAEDPVNWFGPHNWLIHLPDVFRSRLTVTYFDGVAFLVERLRILAEETSATPPELDFLASHEGYHAVHLAVNHDLNVLDYASRDRVTIRGQLELQVTTTIQDVIGNMLHEVYEDWRMTGSPSNWEWDIENPAFSVNYLGSTLHYLEGMIVVARQQGRTR